MAEVEPDLFALPFDDVVDISDDDYDDDDINISGIDAMADLAGTLDDPSHFYPSDADDSDLLDDPLSLALDLFDRRSPSPPPDPFGLDLGFAGSGLAVHREGLQIAGLGDGDDAPDLCWDCLRMDEDRRGPDEDLEWEEVDGGSCLDEQEVLNMMVGVAVEVDDGPYQMDELHHADPELDEELELHGNAADWEILLAGDNAELYAEDQEGFMNTSEYEVLFGQFNDDESAVRGSPPAAKSVVENLPSIILGVESPGGSKNNTLCAVCKDEISLREAAKQLPCMHHYHGECILQWLRIRNTCPVCRYELPTDDPDYENSKGRRQDGGALPM